MIDNISAEQAARFPAWVSKCVEIGLSTATADFDRATAAALRAYELCNLKRPTVVLRMGSPFGATMGGILAWGLLRELDAAQVESPVRSQVRSQVESPVRSQVRSQVESQVGSQVWSQVRSQVGSQVWSQVGSPVESQVWAQVRSQVQSQVEAQVESQVWAQVRSQVRPQVESQVWSQVGSQVRAQVWSQVGSQVWSQVRAQVRLQGGSAISNDRGGSLWAGWGACVSFLRDVLGWSDGVLDRFAIDEDLIESCGWVWWHENILAISDRPSALHRNDVGQLHNDSGPAIGYRDGWKLWLINGVNVDEQIVMRPETQTIDQINGEPNEEVKRLRIERYGWPAYLAAIKARRTDSRKNDIEGTRESLYSANGMAILVCACPSTGKLFSLEVPPETATCDDAQRYLSSGLSSRIISAA